MKRALEIPPTARLVVNRRTRTVASTGSPDPGPFHRKLPGYAAGPVRSIPRLARRLGLAAVDVKDESSRFGLPAFKILGASWATFRALSERLGHEPERWETLEDLAEAFEPLRPLRLVTATDGNHGRALARVARWLRLEARILVPRGTARSRIEAIAEEGAVVDEILGSYDDAVSAAARLEGPRTLIVSDTSWPGYERIPAWVIEGYRTLFEEADAGCGAAPPNLVVVPCGVGALAAAAVLHYRRSRRTSPTRLVVVEPVGAACALASCEAGRPVTVRGPHRSIMAGLNCGTPSLVAWPILDAGVDAFLEIADGWAVDAMRALRSEGIAAGETGAASLAGLLALASPQLRGEAAAFLGLESRTRALVLLTEGPTDPDAYARLVSGPPAE